MTDEIRLARPDVGESELAAIREVLADGRLTMGGRVPVFEGLVARACGVEHAVAVSSGTAAIHLALLALGIGPGDEVIVPAYTFPATANAVELCGAAALTPRSRAVLAVHLFGRPLDWAGLEVAAGGVPLVEDAAGALGALYRGRPCGSLGVMGCLSFHPRKIVTTGEGGAVTTDEEAHADSIRRLRHHGIVPHGDFDIPQPGLNYRLSDVLCALGIPQLERLDQLLAARGRVVAGYAERLAGVAELPQAAEGDRHGWQAYVVRVDRRDEVLASLRATGIEAQIGTYALHRLTAYRDQGPFPGADEAFERALALPFHTSLTDAELDRVAEALAKLA